MDVVLLDWPREDERRARLDAAGAPRLLVIDDHAPPPEVTDPLEDWVRVSSNELDRQVRVRTLKARASALRPSGPVLDDDGLMHVNGSWASLPPVETRLARALLSRLGSVVSRELLSESGWPDGAPGRNALDVHMLRLRRRLAPLGLSIRTVRSRGYLLEGTTRTVVDNVG
jgi:hypothetical protein